MISRVLVAVLTTLLAGVVITQTMIATAERSAGAASVVMLDGVATLCNSVGPDVIVYELPGLWNYAAVGGIDAFSVGTTSANIGDTNLEWVSNTNQHPVIGQNLYQLDNGRFRQIGQSWLKHGFLALADPMSGGECACINPLDSSKLGPGCTDPYGAWLNGLQSGLGPKFEVNAHTGFYSYPPTDINETGDAIFKRLQVKLSDLDVALQGGGLYYIEGHYVTPDDAAAGNQDNNVSHREVTFAGGAGDYSIGFAAGSTTHRELPAITEWKFEEPGVDEQWVTVPGEGTVIIACAATDLGSGQWHYEYAVYNMNSDRSISAFSVPIPPATTVSNVGFHDVDYHSGEPFSSLPWADNVSNGAVTWSTEAYDVNPDANALRWGTLYNFWFDCDAPPRSDAPLTLGLFKPGATNSFRWNMTGPDTTVVDCNGNLVDDTTDINGGFSADANDNGIPDECESIPEEDIAAVTIVAGLTQPIGVGAPTGDFDRLFIVQQTGQIRIYEFATESIRVQNFLDLSGQISVGGERGLLGLAFHPNYAANGYCYVNYTDTSGDTQISRFTVSGDPFVADAGSEHPILRIDQDYSNHNGGQLAFGPDGMLYIGTGDGGSQNDPNQRGQDPQSLLGKMLRIDVDGDDFLSDPDRNYAIPADNPFVGEGATLPEIWALGLRNPWRFSFDRLTGDLYIADVGQSDFEEINFQPASSPGGENYGWRCYEGDDPNPGSGISVSECPPAPELTFPVHSIEHSGGVCSVIGGYVYRGSAIAGLGGAYFYADFCADFIDSLRVQNGSAFDLQMRTADLQPGGSPITSIVSFGEDASGELYIISSLGTISKIVPANGAPVCGNGILESGEVCDDGNTTPGDGCTDCQPDFVDNDDCIDAIEICDQDVVTGSTIDATLDGAGGCEEGLSTSPDRWYTYTAPADGNVTLDLCSSSYDTYIGVHDGCPGTGANQLYCNDDGCPTSLYRSVLTFPVLEGVTYYLRVGGWAGGSVGDYIMTITGPLCELADCNGNGIDDALDISSGNSLDCNLNGIPDECDFGTSVGHPIAVKPPLNIPDDVPAFSSHAFNLPESGIITDVDVDLLIDHTFNGDLIVRLTHNGTTIDLINRPGGAGAFDGDGYDITLDDEGTGGFIETVNDPAGVISPPSYKPDMALDAFDGMEQSGDWTLEISDNAAGDVGQLLAWGLTITTAGGPNPCDCNDNGVADADEIAGDPSLDLDVNGQLDSCQIEVDPTLDLDGGPVGVRSAGDTIFNTFCFGCHDTDGSGGAGFPGPNIRNKSRRVLWQKLWPPTDHPGGAFAGFTDQDFADIEAYLADAGSRGRPDRVLDSVQVLDDCDADTDTDGYELEFGTQVDLNYDGLPDDCVAICAGDVFGVSPGAVDIQDLLAVLTEWGQVGPPRPDSDVSPFPTGDNQVNILDLLAVLANWGICP